MAKKMTQSSTRDLDVVGTDQGVSLQGEGLIQSQEIKRRSVKGAFAYIFRAFLLTGISAVALLLVGAKISPAEYGIFGMVVTITGFFTVISDVGLADSIIQKKETPTLRELRTVFTAQQILAWV